MLGSARTTIEESAKATATAAATATASRRARRSAGCAVEKASALAATSASSQARRRPRSATGARAHRMLGAAMTDAARERFGKTAQLVAEQQDRRAAETRERLARLLTLTGEERALDVGTGAGALAIALAPFVSEAIGVDVVPELLAEGRARAPANVRLIEADATALPFPQGSFDLVTTARTLHHVARPELVLAEMDRVLRPGGTMLVVDLIASGDPLAAIELNTFERARDPSTTRILADV